VYSVVGAIKCLLILLLNLLSYTRVPAHRPINSYAIYRSVFQHYVAVPVSVSVTVSVTVSVKTLSVPAVPYAIAAASARQAQKVGRRVSRAKEWAELQASWLRREEHIRKNRTRSYMNGSTATGELTETENGIFLSKLRSSYEILADERNSYVLLQRTTAIRKRRNGYVTVETTHYFLHILCGRSSIFFAYTLLLF